MPPSTAVEPPDSPDPAPRGTTGTRCRLAQRSTACTSAVHVAPDDRQRASRRPDRGPSPAGSSSISHRVGDAPRRPAVARQARPAASGLIVPHCPDSGAGGATRVANRGLRRRGRLAAVGYRRRRRVRHTLPDGRVLLDDVTSGSARAPRRRWSARTAPGKTTLLRIIAGDLAAQRGSVARAGGLGVMRQFIGSVRDDTTVQRLPRRPRRRPPVRDGLGRRWRPPSWR